MDFKTAANILGHDIEMTMKVYLRKDLALFFT